jgi:hypothetical protein
LEEGDVLAVEGCQNDREWMQLVEGARMKMWRVWDPCALVEEEEVWKECVGIFEGKSEY